MEVFLDFELLVTFPGLSLDYEGFLETITHWCSPKLASENKANVCYCQMSELCKQADTEEQ